MLSDDYADTLIRFANDEPEEAWIFYYNMARYMNKRDFEKAGTIFGLMNYVMGNWNRRHHHYSESSTDL